MIKVRCTGRRATCTSLETITSGSAGMSLHICYDAAWSDLRKIVVCKAGDVSFDVLDLGGGDLRIPHEVLQVAGVHLLVGVCGVDLENQIVIPTVYADCGLIVEGADPQEDAALDPTLPVWAQLVDNMGDLANLDTQVKDNLVAAINEVLASGGVDPEVVAEAVEQYMEAHPFVETDPTVPAWAKQSMKPTYTAQEVGAEPTGAVATHNVAPGAHSALFAEKQDIIEDLNDIRENAEAGAGVVDSVISVLEKIPPAATSDNKLADKSWVNALISALTKASVGLGNVENERQYSAQNPPPYPVLSVNNKTGAVILTPADLGIGNVFTLKGSKNTASDLPASGNAYGDVWYVVAESVGYIWLNDGTEDRWEMLGLSIDLSAYRTASAQDVIDNAKQPRAVSVEHITATTVEGALAEIAEKLEQFPTEIWEGGSY